MSAIGLHFSLRSTHKPEDTIVIIAIFVGLPHQNSQTRFLASKGIFAVEMLICIQKNVRLNAV